MKPAPRLILIALICLVPLAAQSPISISRSGAGPTPLVFLPCLGCRGEIWEPLVKHLSKHYPCVIVSIAGFGEPSSAGFDIASIRIAIAETAKKEKWANPILVGHSFGGFLALSLAVDHPDLFTKLVIVDAYPAAAALLQPALTAEAALKQAEMVRKATLGLPGERFRLQQEQMLRISISNQSQAANVLQWILASDRPSLVQGQYEMLSSDLRPRLGVIEGPILVLGTFAGREPFGLTREVLEPLLKQQYQAARDCTIVISPDSRHFVMLDRPEWLLEQLEAFLKR